MAAEIAVLAEDPSLKPVEIGVRVEVPRGCDRSRASLRDIRRRIEAGTDKNCLNQEHLRAQVISTIMKCSLESDG
jgi:hypothetical protein